MDTNNVTFQSVYDSMNIQFIRISEHGYHPDDNIDVIPEPFKVFLENDQIFWTTERCADDLVAILEKGITPTSMIAADILSEHNLRGDEVSEFSVKALKHILKSEGYAGNEDVIEILVDRIHDYPAACVDAIHSTISLLPKKP